MKLLDLFCGAGGCSVGYARAGFRVTGLDIEPHRDYPFLMRVADAMDVLQDRDYLQTFDVIHASPPCQAYTLAGKVNDNEHPDLVAPVRDALVASGVPYVIENVPGAPLINPITLCGAMFGLGTYRHRLFESNVELTPPDHPEHVAKTTKMGRPPKPGEFMHVVGNFSGVVAAREAMGIPWMKRDDLREAVPPAYTEFIGERVMAHINERLTA